MAAITMMNATYFRKYRASGLPMALPIGVRIQCTIIQVTTPDTVITNVTAQPMPKAMSTLRDTPRNGQMPRNVEKTKLLISTTPMKIPISAPKSITHLPSPPRGTAHGSRCRSRCPASGTRRAA